MCVFIHVCNVPQVKCFSKDAHKKNKCYKTFIIIVGGISMLENHLPSWPPPCLNLLRQIQAPQSSYLYVYGFGQNCISGRSLCIYSRFKSSFVLSVWWKVTTVTGLLGRGCWEDLLGLPSKHLQSQRSDSKNKMFSISSHAATSLQILAFVGTNHHPLCTCHYATSWLKHHTLFIPLRSTGLKKWCVMRIGSSCQQKVPYHP